MSMCDSDDNRGQLPGHSIYAVAQDCLLRRDLTLHLMFCYRGIANNFRTRDLCFQFMLGPTSYVVSPDYKQLLQLRSRFVS